MITSKLHKFAWVFFALALGTSSLFAQGWRGNNRTNVQNNQSYSCLDVLSGLTEDQTTTITELDTKHRETMDVLRDKRRSTTNFDEKDLIREEMLENIVSHRSAVKNLLTEDQQKEYDLLQLRGNNFRNQRVANGDENFQGRGRQGNFRNGRGNGYGPGNQQGNYCRNNGNCPRFNNRGFRGQGRN